MIATAAANGRWVLLAVLALLGACARNPVSGRPELTLMSAAEERRIAARRIREMFSR